MKKGQQGKSPSNKILKKQTDILLYHKDFSLLYFLMKMLLILSFFLLFAQHKPLEHICHSILFAGGFCHIICRRLHVFLGIRHGNTKTCCLNHGQVIFTVPNGNDLPQRYTGFFCCFPQSFALADTSFDKFQILGTGEEMIQFSRFRTASSCS